MQNSVSNHETAARTSPRDPWLPTWDASYAANTGHHRVHDADFLATTPLEPSARVLDLGCGPGDFTRVVADLVPDGEVVGLDPQPALLAEARRVAGPNQSFVEGPVQHLDRLFPEDEQFDGVMTRAAMQWVPMADHPRYLAQVRRLLRPGAWFRLEMGGAGNIAPLAGHLEAISLAHGGPPAPWSFPDAGTYFELLETAGFDVDPGRGASVTTVAQRRAFDRSSLLGWLRSQCFQGFEIDMPAGSHAAFRAEVEARLDELRRADGTFDQTYVRLNALAFAP
ncbi:MAG TPA: methyltransferase domain-containing protein [Acidimicrobiales bacterium]|nr:methyltransferase domain-containing protein [Acidimicrobiales bacterium]